MPKESESERKFKIRPRGLDKEPVKAEEGEEPGEEETPKHKWGRHLRQIGKKFPTKNIAKPLSPDEAEASDEKKPTEDSGAERNSPAPTSSNLSGPEGWESLDDPTTESLPPVQEEKKPAGKPPGTLQLLRLLARKRVRLVSALAAGLATVIFFCLVFWNLGTGAGRAALLRETSKEGTSVSGDFLAQIDQALADLRAGDADKAVKKLQELEKPDTQVASLTYLLALAAMQNGDTDLAAQKAAESIAKRERVSDSLALQAVLETQKGGNSAIPKFGDPRLRSELLLRQAILADTANPFPMIELATLLRYQKRRTEAQDLLRAARSRLNPVDSHTVVDVTLELSQLQDTPDDSLPRIADPDRDFASAFSAAYIAMRRRDFDQAAGLLETLSRRMPADLFYYLVNDPALRRYAAEPKLQKFFQ